MKLVIGLMLATILFLQSDNAAGNCRAKIGSALPDQFGHIVLFSSLSGGPKYNDFTFWAIVGPSDTMRIWTMPIKFTPELEQKVRTWDWRNLALKPPIIAVQADGIIEGGRIWLKVKRIFETKFNYEEALSKFPDAHKGTCGSNFSAFGQVSGQR